MATVIDTLVVELGLDITKFSSAQTRALEDAKKYVENLRQRGNEVEAWGHRISDVFQKLKTEAVAFAGAAFGGYELRQMIERVTGLDAALARMERTTRISRESALIWGNAVRLVGGNIEDALQGITALNNQIEETRTLGQPVTPQLAQFLNVIGGTNVALRGGPNAINDILLLARSYLERSGLLNNPVQAATFLRGAGGLNESLINLLLRPDFRRLFGEAGTLGGRPLPNAEAFVEAQGKLGIAFDQFSRAVTLLVASPLASAFEKLANILSGDITTDAGDPNRRRGLSQFRYYWDQLFGGATPTPTAAPVGGLRASDVNPLLTPGYQGDPRHLIPFIRQTATSMGIDPDTAVRVAQSEGLSGFLGDQGTSFGAFQLHQTPGGRGGAVGDEFRRETGLDPSDPKNEQQTILYALAWAKTHGWGDFHGAANSRIGPWAGISRNTSNVSNSSKTANIGTINVHTQATDAARIAKELNLAVVTSWSDQ